jgi:hypothetical protein
MKVLAKISSQAWSVAEPRGWEIYLGVATPTARTERMGVQVHVARYPQNVNSSKLTLCRLSQGRAGARCLAMPGFIVIRKPMRQNSQFLAGPIEIIRTDDFFKTTMSAGAHTVKSH